MPYCWSSARLTASLDDAAKLGLVAAGNSVPATAASLPSGCIMTRSSPWSTGMPSTCWLSRTTLAPLRSSWVPVGTSAIGWACWTHSGASAVT